MSKNKCQLEHANINVRNLDEAKRFLTTAFPDFKVRRDAGPDEEKPWIHIGTDSTYIALSRATEHGAAANYRGPGINHLGFVVDDIDDIKQRLSAAGYKEGIVCEPHPYRKRLYFHDADGLEWEFIQYLSDDPGERNDYTL